MNKLPILFYRKLKQTPKVFILPMHNSAILELSTKHAFAGITECKSGIGFSSIYYGYLETSLCQADEVNNCELEMSEQCFEDAKQYTKEEVKNILHPIMYNELKCWKKCNTCGDYEYCAGNYGTDKCTGFIPVEPRDEDDNK